MADPKLPDMPPLHQLLRLLKSNGFVLGLDDYLRVAEYEQWMLLDETVDRAAVRAQLGALLCRSDEQQDKFGALFDRYFPPSLQPLDQRDTVPATAQEQSVQNPADTTTTEPTPAMRPAPPPGAQPIPSATGTLAPVLPLLHFPVEHLRLWNLIDMGAALTPLQEKVWTDTAEWDIPGTIRAVVRSGGFPKLVYKKRKQAPRYLALIEQKSSRDHLAGYAAELMREITRRDLEADFYFFDNNPAHCWKEQREVQTHVSIERLRSEWSGARLLLLSHASRFVDPESGVPTNLALDLYQDFSNVALLATNTAVEWGTAERSLSSLMPVIPMSVEGLAKLMNLWNGAAPPGTEDWQQLLPEPSAPDVSVRKRKTDLDGFYAELYRYLGEQAFRWLCACAVYPEIYFELTCILHDEAIPLGQDLSEWQRNEHWNKALRRLSRLAWFRNGHLPEAVATELKKWLSPHDLAEVEKEIRRILELSKNRVAEDTPAAGLRRDLFNWMSFQNFRVLWIDDNPQNNVGYIDAWSKELGILFRTADSNLDAVYKLSSETFDLVISDIGRPSESKPGLTTLQMVNGRAPVIFFTNKRGMNLRRTLKEAGAREVTDSEAVLDGLLKEAWEEKFGVKEQVTESAPPEEEVASTTERPYNVAVLAYQQKLRQLGFYQGEPNGVEDARNRAAIQEFQKSQRMFADGSMGPQTMKALENTALSKGFRPAEQSQSAPLNPNEHLVEMINDGRIEEALEEMLDLWPDQNELILFAAKYHGEQGQQTSKT